MDSSKKRLKTAYLKAMRRLARENDIIDRARDRKYYWQSKVKNLENNLELVQSGQLEFSDFNQKGVDNVDQ